MILGGESSLFLWIAYTLARFCSNIWYFLVCLIIARIIEITCDKIIEALKELDLYEY
jgi:hypothetical protein